jgi:flagellar motor protein MotB
MGSDAYSQFDILKKKLEKKTEEAVEEAITGEEPEEEPKEEQAKEEKKTAPKEDPKAPKEDLKSYSKFDFIPGENVIYFEDFAKEEIGSMPMTWWTDGSGEVVTLSKYPGNWLKIIPSGTFFPDPFKTLPENFTFEFDVVFQSAQKYSCLRFDFVAPEKEDHHKNGGIPGNGGFAFNFNCYQCIEAWQWKQGNFEALHFRKETDYIREKIEDKIHISISVQKSRCRMYVDDMKIFDNPRFVMTDLVYSRVRFCPWDCGVENVTYLSNIKLAVGTPDNRSKLMTEGKLVTRGITFDTGSDKIKPESYGTLKDIANVLKENAEVRVKIIGHTDNSGAYETNMTLSQKRAEAVKNALNQEFGIDLSRMETEGKGAKEPASTNDTPEGKASNRRVEFVKL